MPVVPQGTVVKEFKLGNTRIKICNDAYINRTPEEIQQSIKRINQICLKCIKSDSFKLTIKPCAGDVSGEGSQ